jgi:type 1 glutamine amidotransferase
MKIFRQLVAALALVTLAAAEDKILVYTRNYTPDGKGYVHANIATSVATLKAIAQENGFSADSSDNPAVFTLANLKQYKAIVFSNSNNEAFTTEEQRDALRKFVQGGGGVMGIHSATGSERKWPYWWSMMGGRFIRHPKLQRFTITVKDNTHPATKGLPATFEWEDECYLFADANPNVKVLLTADPAQLEDPKRTSEPGALRDGVYPISWYNTYDGGRQYYVGLGHKDEHYANPLFRQQLTGGLLWVLGKNK